MMQLVPHVNLPEIEVGTDITSLVDQLEEAITRLPEGPHLFQRARQLCILAHSGKPPRWLRRPPDVPIIVPAELAYLRELAAQAAIWKKYDIRGQKWLKTLPPLWVVETLNARPSWPFPSLEGVVCTPTLRPDGSLLYRPGYDVETGLYVDFNGMVYPPISDRPTRREAQAAIEQLKEPLRDFPFAKECHRTAALAAILSVIARYAIQGNVPLFAVNATTRGSGKGLLIDVISMIATGRHASRWSQTQDEEEERKRLFTVALSGDPLIHIDNVTAPLGSGPLDSAVTAPAIKDRVLGRNTEKEAPMSTVFFASGNNMVFKGDLARRVVPIDLDPKMERPEERNDFHYNPLLPWVLKERPKLVAAALTILRAYFAADRTPQGIPAMGSFEEWSALVRQALFWAGEADPCEGRKNIEADNDPAYEALHNFLTAWHGRYGASPRTVKQLKHDLENHITYDAQAKRLVVHPEWRDLHEVVVSLDKHGREVNIDAIGKAFRSWKGRMVDGMRLVIAGEDTRNKTKLWRVDG